MTVLKFSMPLLQILQKKIITNPFATLFQCISIRNTIEMKFEDAVKLMNALCFQLFLIKCRLYSRTHDAYKSTLPLGYQLHQQACFDISSAAP